VATVTQTQRSRSRAIARVAAWLRQNGYEDVRVLRSEVTIDHPRGPVREVKFDLFLPQLQVYVLVTPFCQNDRSREARRQRSSLGRVTKYAQSQGVGCFYVEGSLLEGLQEGKGSAKNRLSELLHGQTRLAKGEGPSLKLSAPTQRPRRGHKRGSRYRNSGKMRQRPGQPILGTV
jgi:hypothetical protein